MQRSKCKNANPKTVETRAFSRCPNPGFGFGKMSGLPGYPGFSKPGFQSLLCTMKPRSHLYSLLHRHNKARRTWWNKTEIKHWNCFSLIGIFLADRTNGRAIGTVLRLSVVCPSSVSVCIVAKRCVLEQKLLLRAYRKSYIGNRLVPKWMTLTSV